MTESHIQTGIEHIRRGDAVMDGVIGQVGDMRWRRPKSRFVMLARAIVGQQISTSAARTIFARLEQSAKPGPITAGKLAGLSDEDCARIGLSPQKRNYLRDLSDRVIRGDVRLRSIHARDDDEIIAELVRIKGIGEWTAHMFLMFALHRPDVLAWQDLGVRSAIRNLYQLEDLPTRDQVHEIAAPWRPFASIGCWYCWRSLELK